MLGSEVSQGSGSHYQLSTSLHCWETASHPSVDTSGATLHEGRKNDCRAWGMNPGTLTIVHLASQVPSKVSTLLSQLFFLLQLRFDQTSSQSAQCLGNISGGDADVLGNASSKAMLVI